MGSLQSSMEVSMVGEWMEFFMVDDKLLGEYFVERYSCGDAVDNHEDNSADGLPYRRAELFQHVSPVLVQECIHLLP